MSRLVIEPGTLNETPGRRERSLNHIYMQQNKQYIYFIIYFLYYIIILLYFVLDWNLFIADTIQHTLKHKG